MIRLIKMIELIEVSKIAKVLKIKTIEKNFISREICNYKKIFTILKTSLQHFQPSLRSKHSSVKVFGDFSQQFFLPYFQRVL